MTNTSPTSCDPGAPNALVFAPAIHYTRPVSTYLPPASIPHVADVTLVRGPSSTGLAPRLLIEVPHGATTRQDFEELASRLEGPHPSDLIDFFFVNTDSGAPELADAIARLHVERHPVDSVLIVRSRIPRTFIDCNRVIDATPEQFKEGGVAPGLMPWVTTPHDRALLRERYDRYTALVKGARDALPADGAMLLMHTYAPRTVGVTVDHDIVPSLRRAYGPDLESTWPARPELDVIGRSVDSVHMAPPDVVAALSQAFAAYGYTVGDSATYALHPSTVGWHHAVALPGRCICIEVRRDLFGERFIPFVEANPDPARVDALARPISEALSVWWA
ncbi:MAG TPA: N-formylglutamate amidohydrolase [Myxococcota bacterium]|nr:N-formylglutamate amidohydrolase [Myxococcota bacterium]